MGRATASLAIIVFGLTGPAVAQSPGTCTFGSATADLDIGNVRARMHNTGGLFWVGGNPVYEVPKDSGSNAIFASGIWVGGMVDGALRMAAATYSDWEFWPGPLDAAGNPPANCSVFDRIYRISRDDLQTYDEHGVAAPDLAEWPAHLGAPVKDGDGNPNNYSLAAGDRPELLGDQMAWWVMQDAGNLHLTTETAPIGLEIRVSAFAFERDDYVGNTTFYRYEPVYKGSSPVEDMYFGFWSDPDLGDASDDFVGSDSLLGLGFVYNGDDFDGGAKGYGSPPPALGYDVLRGPLADSDGRNNDYDGQVDEPGESQSMTTFIYYQSSSTIQGNPSDAEDLYYYLQGRWRDGRPMTYGGNGLGFSSTPTHFMFSGDPPAFWSEDNVYGDGVGNNPAERRFLASTGPFRMEPGSVEEIWLAIIWSRGEDRLDSVQELKRDSESIQSVFDSGFEVPEQAAPQESPALIAPDDGASGQPYNVALRWGRVPNAPRFIWQVATDPGFDDIIASDLTTRQEAEVESTRSLAPGTSLWWRVRGVNTAGDGPWSGARTFTLGADSLYAGQSGPVIIDDEYMFVEVAGPDDSYACRPNAGSRFGCDEVGGNHVYGSENGSGEYIMWHEGTGSEATLGPFSPNDYEIRFTETGSYAYHWFETESAIWVPFEVWDIGRTYTGTNVNPNDPADDVRMIPILFTDGRPECEYRYHDDVNLAPFGVWSGTTQRIYAYYPFTDYAAWEAYVKPLVDTDANHCPVIGDVSDEGSPALVDIGHGRPLQRIIFEGDPAADPPHPGFGVTVRFYTLDRIPPAPPIQSSPRDGATGLALPITLWWNAPDGRASHVEVASDPDFDEIVIYNVGTTITELPAVGTYYWRGNITNENGTSGWSRVWSFTVASLVALEQDGLPDRFALHPNYPNPFNPETTIRFDLPKAEQVTLEIFDALGRRVATLVDGRLAAGRHRTRWNASQLASGLYLYRLRAGSSVTSRAMTLAK